MRFSIKDFFSKCDHICSFLLDWLYLLKTSLMESFLCIVLCLTLEKMRKHTPWKPKFAFSVLIGLRCPHKYRMIENATNNRINPPLHIEIQDYWDLTDFCFSFQSLKNVEAKNANTVKKLQTCFKNKLKITY